MDQGQLILDRYEPLGTAGAGGFGTVRIAWDPRIQRKVAIKTIQLSEIDAHRAGLPGAQAIAGAPASTQSRWRGVQPWDEFLAETTGENVLAYGEVAELPTVDAASERGADGSGVNAPKDPVTALAHLPGLDEARTAAKLQDVRIVTVFDFEVRGQVAYLIMEYIEGITLSRILAQYEDFLTLDVVAAVFDAVAGALMVAHKAGVLHLDIKPDNIIVNVEGQAKVTDFGLATLADASGAGTTGGGTIGYMPLEQMRREPLDARTDEWSLASVTYEMLTGDNPFRVRSLADAEQAILNAELVLPSLCWDDIDEQIDDVVFYALDPNPDERYASIADFAEEADKFLGDPEKGKRQLAAIVADALGLYEEEEEVEEEDQPESRPRAGVLSRLKSFLPAPRVRGATRREMDSEEPDNASYREGNAGDRELRPRRRIDEQSKARWLTVGAHVAGAVGSGLLAWIALSNLTLLDAFAGSAAAFIAGVLAIAVGAAGAFRPHIGALTAFVLLGFSLATAGDPIVGAILLLAAFAWWYTVGYQDRAASNTALFGPLLGAIGGSSAIPLIAGELLRPPAAIATAAFSAVVAMVFASFGSGSLLDWNAFAFHDFRSVDVTASLLALVAKPNTWTTAASWVAAAAIGSFLGVRGSRLLSFVGLAASVVVVVAGSVAFAEPTTQLAVTMSLTTVGLLVVQLNR